MRNGKKEPLRAHKKHKRSRVVKPAPIVLLLAVTIIAAFSLRNLAFNSLLEFTAAESGELVEKIEARAVLMRQEYLLTAPADGVFYPSVQEGARVTADFVLGHVSGASSTRAVTAPGAGIVSFTPDGFESLLSFEDIAGIDIKKVFELAAQGPLQWKSGERLERGDVFGKIINNLANHFWLIIYYPERNDMEVPANGDLSFSLADGRALSGRVVRQGPLEDGRFFIVRVNMREDGLGLKRTFSVYSVGEKFSGVIVPQSALLEKEGQGWGVYVREKNMLVFKTVEVLGVTGGRATVSGVEQGADVLVKPQYAKEGRRVK